MVGAALVSVIEQPDVSDIGDFVVCTIEEWLEVLCGFNELWQPDHSGKIRLSSSDVGTGEFDLIGVGLSGSL